MGQAYGKPSAHTDVKWFTNLPKEAVQSLWTSYNLHGEGWGLELFDFMVIFKEAAYFMSLGFTDEQLEALFNAFDTDSNGLVDALELIFSLVLASGKFGVHVYMGGKKERKSYHGAVSQTPLCHVQAGLCGPEMWKTLRIFSFGAWMHVVACF